MAVKCDIAKYALQYTNSLFYGVSCENAVCRLIENYIEYLNCPIDIQFCSDFPCESISETVDCDQTLELTVDSISASTAIATFVQPSGDYDIYLFIGNTIIKTFHNPSSSLLFSGLLYETEYRVSFVAQCPHGEQVFLQRTFTTLIGCAVITDIVAVMASTD